MRKTRIATTGLANEHHACNGSLCIVEAHIDRIGSVDPARKGEHDISATRRRLQCAR